MIKVKLPDNNHAERKYAVEILLGEFLGLAFELFHADVVHPELTLPNGHNLILEDHFFRHFSAEKSYLNKDNLPNQIKYQKKETNPFLPEADLPIIYGRDLLEVTGNQIICGIDVFATFYFMLTRWEEFVNPARDSHNRFPANASVAGRYDFLLRPILDECAEMVWKMLQHLGINQARKHRAFKAIITHDVDMPRLWRSFPLFIKKLGGDIFKRKSFEELKFSLKSYAATRFGNRQDPYDTFDYLMEISESVGLRSHFFFMSGGRTSFDNFFNINSPYILKLLQRIHERGHVIGFHPSYDAYHDEKQFRQEVTMLRSLSLQPVVCGRQHFLRFEAPATWQIWEDNGMKWDSTMGYPEKAGFRCGTCQPFPLFNFMTRQKLRLMEIPLTVMEGTLVRYQKLPPQVMYEKILQLIGTVKKYNGTFVLLWHNSAFNSPDYESYQWMYPKIIEEIGQALLHE